MEQNVRGAGLRAEPGAQTQTQTQPGRHPEGFFLLLRMGAGGTRHTGSTRHKVTCSRAGKRWAGQQGALQQGDLWRALGVPYEPALHVGGGRGGGVKARRPGAGLGGPAGWRPASS